MLEVLRRFEESGDLDGSLPALDGEEDQEDDDLTMALAGIDIGQLVFPPSPCPAVLLIVFR